MKRHNKRYGASTKRWGLPVKEHFWAPKVSSGPHPAEESVPLLVIVRDILQYANTAREAKMIIGSRRIQIDGRVITDEKVPVGLMDVISIPDLGEHYRMLFDQHGRARLLPLEKGDEKWKLCRIEDKRNIKGGLVQYNLHDGRNLRSDDIKKYDTMDVLKLEIPNQNVMDSYKFEEGSMALITKGKHIGEIGKIKEREIVKSSKPNLVHFEEGISTVEDYVFIIGKDKPVIEIPEVGII